MKYSLRSLMIVVMLGPPLLASAITLAARFFSEPELTYDSRIENKVLYIAPGPGLKLVPEMPDYEAPAANPPKP